MLFEKFADDYARFRPDYPANLIESIVNRFQLSSNSRILDLACGTGNLTRQLREITHSPVFGIDLSMIMLKHNRESRIACAKAEALPVKASMFDTVLVGQAFHWFKFDIALAEISRTLKPGGGLAIIWYRRKKSLMGHRLKMDELVKRYNPDYKPGFMDYNWRKVLTSHDGFADIDNFAAECVYKYSISDYLKPVSYTHLTLPTN